MKIGIANDLVLAAEALRRSINTHTKHEVLWVARDGAEAVARCENACPDLILMDLFMPRLNGIEATRQIMARTPCAIVVATARVEDHISQVFAAMGAGALDAVDVPPLAGAASSKGVAMLLAKIQTIEKLLGATRSPKSAKTIRAVLPPTGARAPDQPGKLVVIGASAGGPAALTAILAGLPATFPAAIVVVQHVDQQFAAGLAEWLASRARLPVRVVAEGDRVEPGRVFLAGRNQHLVMSSGTRLSYSLQPHQSAYCPSVDVFFHSVARHWRGMTAGILLTGMGRDGAEGLKALREAGHHTIAQNRLSSTVYGMPKAAVELQAAREILALDKIAPRLISILSQTHGHRTH